MVVRPAQRDLSLVHPGWPPLSIRWVLVVDPADPLATDGFFTTDLTVPPARMIEWFVLRWSIEVTDAEVRRYLGVEIQRQWAAKAIARTTPALLALFSIVYLKVYRLRDHWVCSGPVPLPGTSSRRPLFPTASRWCPARFGPREMTSTRSRTRIRSSFPALPGSAYSRNWPRPPERCRSACHTATPPPRGR